MLIADVMDSGSVGATRSESVLVTIQYESTLDGEALFIVAGINVISPKRHCYLFAAQAAQRFPHTRNLLGVAAYRVRIIIEFVRVITGFWLIFVDDNNAFLSLFRHQRTMIR